MNVIKNRKKYFCLSLAVILCGLAVMLVNQFSGKGAFNLDIEFTGGTAMQIDIGQEFENNDIAAVVQEISGQNSPQIQRILGTTQVSIKMQRISSEMRMEVIRALQEKYAFPEQNVMNVSDISATVSSEMQKAATVAVIVACIAMLIYISIRFRDMRAGASAILALVHDVLVVLAFYAILRIPVNNSFIAALLTVLGYSINATIVIFDRVRENKMAFRKHETINRMNKSINQTLSRSINTSLTTLFTIGAIYLLGVSSIKEFALPLIIGIISGTYSSIFIAGSLWYLMMPKSEK